MEKTEDKPLPKKRGRKPKYNYIDNQKFSVAILEYNLRCDEVRKRLSNQDLTEKEIKSHFPVVDQYIAKSFLDIVNHLARRPNFSGYHKILDDMKGDAVENCLRALHNFTEDRIPKDKKPNAFAYFTQCIWWAFVRRIKKENKETDIKNKYWKKEITSIFIKDNQHFTDEIGIVNITNSINKFLNDIEKSKQ